MDKLFSCMRHWSFYDKVGKQDIMIFFINDIELMS